jgi:hypothetical protein
MGMTVARLRQEMPQREFVEWNAYHGMQAQRAEIAAKRR